MQGPLRILAILNGSVRGYAGGDLHTVAVLNQWVAANQVDLFLPWASSPEVSRLLRPEVRATRRTAPHQTPSRLVLLALFTLRLFATCAYVLSRRGRWDVVIASSHFPYDAIPMLLAGASRAAGVYWHHHLPAVRVRASWVDGLVRLSESLLAKALSKTQVRIFTGNSETRDWLVGKGVPANAIALTPNGPSFLAGPLVDSAPPTDWVVHAYEGKLFVLYCARLSNLKGAGDLPSIARNLIASGARPQIVVCGEGGSEAIAARRALADLEMTGDVRFLGFVQESTKKWLLQNAHVLIAPSYEEGWGLTVSDGVASGTWVVAYDLPALRESCPVGPIFVPVGDVDAFSHATVECLGKRRPGMSSGGPKHDWARIASDDLQFVLGQVPAELTWRDSPVASSPQR